jgi:hypothetical protein
LYVQGILENPSKAIAVEGSNNHALNPSDEVVLNLFFFILLIQFRVFNHLFLGIDNT